MRGNTDYLGMATADAPPLGFKVKGSFPYDTINKRMPIILTKAIDNMCVRRCRAWTPAIWMKNP